MSRQSGNLSDDLVAELRKWGALKVGDQFPVNNWGPALSELLNAAADKVELMDRIIADLGGSDA